MKLRPIIKYTVVHYLVTLLLWFLSLGVVLGLGFKDNWTVSDHILSNIVVGGAKIMSFPIWQLYELKLPEWMGYFFYVFQVIVSFIQVNFIMFVITILKTRLMLAKGVSNNDI